jgi:hypothetical protein
MHERSAKSKPLDAIFYEIDMFRHCAGTLEAKETHRSKSQFHNAEYYLAIEGFLLHLRNLLAFFMSHCSKPTDLGINRTELWAVGRSIEKCEYSDLMKGAREVNIAYETKMGPLYEQISRFLQHCTTFRHTEARAWDVEGIFRDFDPILIEFVKRFGQ